jgi:hypothetical protein
MIAATIATTIIVGAPMLIAGSSPAWGTIWLTALRHHSSQLLICRWRLKPITIAALSIE